MTAAGPMPPPPPPPPKRVTHAWAIWLAGFLGAGVVVAVVVAAMHAGSVSGSPGAPVASTEQVVYEVTGSATQTSITYTNADGETSQQSEIDVPMVSQATGLPGIRFTTDSGAMLYLSAQNVNEDGDITCTITVDGVVVSTNTSYGGYTIATCTA